MLINPKSNQPARRKWLLVVVLLFFSAILASCLFKTTSVSLEGTWIYPGGGSAPMSMVFHPGGRLTFVGGFKNFQPATWHFDDKTRKLQIKVSNYDKSPTECSSLYTDDYSCLHYNPKTDFFECIITLNTKSVEFLGWNFFRQ